MFNGYSTLGAVALRIAEDYIRFPMKRDCRYTVEQAISKVCFREESMAAAGSSPAYVWAWFALDEGETSITLDHDSMKLAEVPLGGRSYRYVPLKSGDLEYSNLIPEYWPEGYSYDGLLHGDHAMLRSGLGFHQKFLVRYREIWHTDYFGESDCATEAEILYAEPLPNQHVLIPMTNTMVLPLGPKAISVQS